MDHPSACEFRRKDCYARSNLIYLRKTILLVFELSGFSHSQGHGQTNSPRALLVRSTSVSGIHWRPQMLQG